jgi:hypothetical protein
MAELLLDGGADPNSHTTDEHYMTPLVIALLCRRTTCIALLLRRGADANILWLNGMSALGVAVRRGCAESVRQLLAAKASADGSGIGADACVPPLVAASACGNDDLVNALLEAGADVDNTALHNAARGGFVGVVRALLAFGAAVDWASLSAHPCVHTPLYYAVGGGHADVVAVLLAHGADRRLVDVDDSVAASMRKALEAMVPHPRGRWLLEEVRGRCPEEREREKAEDGQRRREHDNMERNAALSRPVAQQLLAVQQSQRLSEPPVTALLSNGSQNEGSDSSGSSITIGYGADDCDTGSDSWSMQFGHAHHHLIETH